MLIKNKGVISGYRTLLVLVALYGLYLNSGLPGTFHLSMFMYYTILSNLLCFIYFSIILFKNITTYKSWNVNKQADNVILVQYKGAITLCITVTFLVYHFMIAPTLATGDTTYGTSLATITTHYIVPIGVILDWLLFDHKVIYDSIDPLKWLVIPLSYVLFAFIYGQFGPAFRLDPVSQEMSRYAYWFIDVDVLGWPKTLLFSLALTLAFLLLGYIIVLIDRAMHSKNITA